MCQALKACGDDRLPWLLHDASARWPQALCCCSHAACQTLRLPDIMSVPVAQAAVYDSDYCYHSSGCCVPHTAESADDQGIHTSASTHHTVCHPQRSVDQVGYAGGPVDGRTVAQTHHLHVTGGSTEPSGCLPGALPAGHEGAYCAALLEGH